MENEVLNSQSSKKIIMRVSNISIVVNVLLSAIKFVVGVIANSGAMISDAIHSVSDVFSTIIVMIGANAAAKDPDQEHPYGHDRMECIAAIVLAIVLFITGIGVGITGVKKIFGGNYGDLAVPGALALVAAVISIVVKEGMFWYTRFYGKKVDSTALLADAWHHRSDALSSVGSFIGILGARLGFPICNPLASVVICLFIVKAAYNICKEALDKMVDKSCDDETERKMSDLIKSQEGVISLDLLMTRMFGSKLYVDVEIGADENTPLRDSHAIAENVHNAIEANFPKVKHCMVHVNPVELKIDSGAAEDENLE
ncbi:MAG: cation diffusion facilitator family transporter [Monoglobus pectinilyticus]|uniref:cation diffusion facilitator family transporter n=1 Tax=Monoglobus pectinilyticus TaxID=1981510 RepID=UPI00300EEAD1